MRRPRPRAGKCPFSANVGPTAELFCTHMGDPANARYLFPLENEDDEDMAEGMASAIYSAYSDHFSPDITKEERDYVWEQCLVDSRRIICDPDYERMFTR